MTTNQAITERGTTYKAVVAGMTTTSADKHQGMQHAAGIKIVTKEERDRKRTIDQMTSVIGGDPTLGPKTDGRGTNRNEGDVAPVTATVEIGEARPNNTTQAAPTISSTNPPNRTLATNIPHQTLTHPATRLHPPKTSLHNPGASRHAVVLCPRNRNRLARWLRHQNVLRHRR
jgi:hypothetical protein